MAEFLEVMGKIYEMLCMPMDIYGFVFSFWDVIIFSVLAGVCIKFVRDMFYEN